MMAVDWDARQASIDAGRLARLRMLTEKRRAERERRELDRAIEAGTVCGYHERPMPCVECA